MELHFFPNIKYFFTLLNASQLTLKVSHTMFFSAILVWIREDVNKLRPFPPAKTLFYPLRESFTCNLLQSYQLKYSAGRSQCFPHIPPYFSLS